MLCSGTMSFFFLFVFTKAVSESLKSLINAAAQDSATDKPAEPSTAPVHRPPSSEAAESKTADDDVMVQITARKSEVGPSRRLVSCFLRARLFQSASSTGCQANE